MPCDRPRDCVLQTRPLSQRLWISGRVSGPSRAQRGPQTTRSRSPASRGERGEFPFNVDGADSGKRGAFRCQMPASDSSPFWFQKALERVGEELEQVGTPRMRSCLHTPSPNSNAGVFLLDAAPTVPVGGGRAGLTEGQAYPPRPRPRGNVHSRAGGVPMAVLLLGTVHSCWNRGGFPWKRPIPL